MFRELSSQERRLYPGLEGSNPKIAEVGEYIVLVDDLGVYILTFDSDGTVTREWFMATQTQITAELVAGSWFADGIDQAILTKLGFTRNI